jgi:hypothetical protein
MPMPSNTNAVDFNGFVIFLKVCHKRVVDVFMVSDDVTKSNLEYSDP